MSHGFPMATLSVTQLLHVDALLFSLWLFYIKSKSAQTKTLEGSPRLSFSWLLVKQERLLELEPWPPPEEHAGQLTHPFRKLDVIASQHSSDAQVQRVGGTPCPESWATTVLFSWPRDTRTPRGARFEDLDPCQDLSTCSQGPAVLELQTKDTLGRPL